VTASATRWPTDERELVSLQQRLAEEATACDQQPLRLPERPLLAGCFVAFARGEAGPGNPGDRAWAGAVTWRPVEGARDEGAALRGVSHEQGPRVARDTHEQAVVEGTVPAAYSPGLLALREGPILERAVAALHDQPDVLLVDATGLDHPRRAGLAIHLGRVLDVSTVGVTHRPLHADPGTGPPALVRGTTAPVMVDGDLVGHWVVTRDGARPVVAHAAWHTDAATAADIVLLASTPSSRTPVPLGEARRIAREARSIASGLWG
jgi:deoxyribonuclease V